MARLAATNWAVIAKERGRDGVAAGRKMERSMAEAIGAAEIERERAVQLEDEVGTMGWPWPPNLWQCVPCV